MDFGKALEQVKAGKSMRLPQWKDDVSIKLWRPKCDLETISKAVYNSWWEEKEKRGITNHPDMKPYEDLSEDIKEYDRVTAKAVIESLNYMTVPYLYVESRYGKVPWKETNIELFAEDWEVID